ncbi:MAG: META domain-containing protein [Patescibacteria group bacterium]
MTSKIIIRVVILIILAVLAIVFLKPKQDEVTPKLPAGSTPPIDISLVADKEWVWEKTVLSTGSTTAPKVPGKFTITLASDTQVSGTTDCNNFSGIYMVGTEGILTFGPFAMTKMYCEGSQEAEFTGELAKVQSFTLTDGNLSLMLEGGEGTMIFTKIEKMETI